MSVGAVILIDDYWNLDREARYMARNEFFAKKRLSVLTLASGQGLVIVNYK